jgi:hypothetical protein
VLRFLPIQAKAGPTKTRTQASGITGSRLVSQRGLGDRSRMAGATVGEGRFESIPASGAPFTALASGGFAIQVGAPNDRYEREADRAADRAMRGAESADQRPAGESGSDHAGSGGRPLPDGVRGSFESRFGADFSRVRVHTDERAAAMAERINARAFTLHQDVYFARNAFAPATSGGRRLIAHELAHTIQQRQDGLSLIQRQGNGEVQEDCTDSYLSDPESFSWIIARRFLQDAHPDMEATITDIRCSRRGNVCDVYLSNNRRIFVSLVPVLYPSLRYVLARMYGPSPQQRCKYDFHCPREGGVVLTLRECDEI